MIGYAPYSNNINAPGDRRRFVFYAKSRNLQFEVADPNKLYDIVYITSSGNLSSWIAYKQKNKNTKLIFEVTNPYPLNNKLIWNLTRGVYRFIQRRERKLYLYYNNAYKDIFKIADAVICSTQEQKDFILKYNQNVHVSIDYFDEDILDKKTSYLANKPFNLVWEGQACSVKDILLLKSVLEKFNNIHLKVITDTEISLPFNFKRRTENLFKGCKFSYEIIPWEKQTFSKEISQADLAIIPIDIKNKLHFYKPENKLILFWKIGIPVLTTNIPSYKKVFKAVKYDLICNGEKDWVDKLNLFIEGKINIEEHMKDVNLYIDRYHNKENILNNWDEIFKSLV